MSIHTYGIIIASTHCLPAVSPTRDCTRHEGSRFAYEILFTTLTIQNTHPCTRSQQSYNLCHDATPEPVTITETVSRVGGGVVVVAVVVVVGAGERGLRGWGRE